MTALEYRLPTIVGLMRGRDPIWLVDGSFGKWTGPDVLAKSVWVLSRDKDGEFTVEGRRLDAPGTMFFQDGLSGSPIERLVITDASAQMITPGGATPEIMERYVFLMMYLIYPDSGCWEITARLGNRTTRIVIEKTVSGG